LYSPAFELDFSLANAENRGEHKPAPTKSAHLTPIASFPDEATQKVFAYFFGEHAKPCRPARSPQQKSLPHINMPSL
jgi:hypothetical protein